MNNKAIMNPSLFGLTSLNLAKKASYLYRLIRFEQRQKEYLSHLPSERCFY
jgi:hypothetical protein